MSFQPVQLIYFIVYAVLLAGVGRFFYTGRYKLMLGCIAVMLVLFTMSPLRWTVTETSREVEQRQTEIEEVPPRIVVDKPNYDESLDRELEAMRSESKELNDEIYSDCITASCPANNGM